MKRIIFIMLLIVALTLPVLGQGATGWNIFQRPTADWFSSGGTKDIGWQWAMAIDRLVAAGGQQVGTGSIFYVDSNVTNAGDGSSWSNAVATLDEAVALCTDDNGDIIYVAQGHSEDWTTTDSADLDVPGITVIGMGQGEHRPIFNYDGTDPELVIADASIAISNLRFWASVDSVVHIIEVEADADGFVIYNCEFMEPESGNTTDEVDDAIQVAAGANQGFIVGNTFYSASAGALTAIDLTAGVIEDITIAYNTIIGDYSEGGIHSDDIDLRARVIGNIVTNTNATGFGILYSTTASGWCINNIVGSKTTSYMIDPGSMQISGNKWVDIDSGDVTAVQMFTSETGVDIWSASQVAQIAGASTTAIEADHLDHLAAVTVADEIVNESFLADITSKTQDWSTFVAGDDSLEAISDAIAALSGVGFRGTATSAGATATFISTGLSGFGNDFFNTNWKMIITFDAGSAGAAPEGDVRDIVDYASGTGTFTVAPVWSGSASTAEGDKAYIVRDQDMNPHDVTILGGSDKVTYVDSGVAGTPDVADLGDTWDLAYPTITAALDAAVTSGEVIYVAPGHSETLAAAYLINDAGVSIIGLGEGSLQPLLTLNHIDAQLDISVADVLIENIRIESQLDNVKIGIDISGTGDGCHIKNCNFTNETSSDELLIAVNLTTNSDDVIIEGCTFLSTGAASTECIKVITGACDNLQILNNWIRGDYTVAAIWSDQALTDCLIKGNVVHQETASQHAIELTSTALGSIVNNRLYADTYASILDPGSCLCTGNLAVDALDQQAIAIPLSAETTDILEVADGSDLERLEYLQNKSDDILAGIRMAGGTIGNVFYVDDATGSAVGGTSWELAEATMDGAHDEVTADSGDIIFLAPDHEEDIATGSPLTWATAGVTIIGIGEGEQQPQITFSGIASSININAASYVFDNINFHSTTADTTIGLDIKDAGDNSVIRNCLFTNASGFEFVSAVEYSDDADNVTVENCRFINTGGADATEAIKNTAGTTIGMRLIGNYIYGAYDAAGIFSDDIDTLCEIRDNIVHNTQTGIHAIEFNSAATGDAIGNMMYSDTYGAGLDPGSMACFGNKHVYSTDMGAIDVPLVPGKQYTVMAAPGSILAASDPVFTIAGGPILIVDFYGVVTSQVGNSDLTVQSIDTVTTTTFPYSTTVACDGDIIGTTYSFTGAVPSVLTPLTGAHNRSGTPPIQWYAPIGNVEVLGDAAVVGVVEWYMTFIPLTTGVIVTDAT